MPFLCSVQSGQVKTLGSWWPMEFKRWPGGGLAT